jgi:diguanylate cyclase (GGDEF)-like protein
LGEHRKTAKTNLNIGDPPLKILLLEDDEDDYIIADELLSAIYGKSLSLDWVTKKEDAIEKIDSEEYDILIFDQFLGATQGLDVIKELDGRAGNVAPIILLTGQDDRETDIQAMNAGATDYLVKQQLDEAAFERAIRYSLKQRKAEREIEQMAYQDALTGLPNRLLFMQQLEYSFELSKRRGSFGSVLFIDLDRFKSINDSLGHAAGDELLKQIAQRLKENVRSEDIVARLGGDEFVVLLSLIAGDPKDALINAQTVVAKIQAALRDPFILEGHELVITPSIGGVTFPEPASSPDTVLRFADTAMYNVKYSGRDDVNFFTTGMETEIQKQFVMKTSLQSALTNGEFHMEYQPILNMDNARVVGAEALIRWNSPSLGSVDPLDFIPIAEKTKLIIEIGDWIFADSIKALAKLPELEFLSINVSSRQFKEANLVDSLHSILSRENVDPRRIILEVTESALFEDIDAAIPKMNALKAIGVRFALDDFGTGYSSMTHLKHLPIDILKIDQSFVRDVSACNKDAAIVKSIILLGNELNMKVIGEGIENDHQKSFLMQHGTSYGQGYLFGCPVRLEAFSANTQSVE